MKFIMCIIVFLLTSCGSGFIGLLEDDKSSIEKMNLTYGLEQGINVYIIEVENYYEKNLNCDTGESTKIDTYGLTVWKIFREWGKVNPTIYILEDPYVNFIEESLHMEYLISVCGE